MFDSDSVDVVCTLDSDDTNTTYYDQNTGLPLPFALVREAMEEEIRYMESLPVWKRFNSRTDLPCNTKHVKTRWVIINKGDSNTYDIRARLVAQEIKYVHGVAGQDATLFSATPPIDAMRALLSRCACDANLVLGQIDIKKAHLYGLSTRSVSVDLPALAGGGVGLLLRTLYGTRDAASAWASEVDKVMSAFGLIRGASCPCLWRCEERNIALLVHGDDVVYSGPPNLFKELSDHLSKSWALSVKGSIGPKGTASDLRILGRLVSYNHNCYTLEADPRHAELLGRLVEKDAVTPGVKPEVFDDRLLGPSDHALFRSSVMRAAYLSIDRPEIQFSVVQLARAMSSPTYTDFTALKRLCKFLKGNPRIVQHFHFQKTPTKLHIECDSDFAGNVITRKSTSGYMAFYGRHCLSSCVKSQSVIALSSGEAEFYSLGGAISRAIGLQSTLADLGIKVTIEVWTDSSAAIGTASRIGLGKAKHICTAYLWLQQLVKDGVITLHKVKGDDNRSDLGTKHLAAPRMWELLRAASFVRATGQHKLTLRAS